ncbi:restriction endonuclease subunit S [Aeromonas crassostreae]
MSQAEVEAMQSGKYHAYPEYKDSGVELLGDIPIHWIVRRLKHTASIQSGIPKGKDLTDKTTISVPMLRVANVQDGYLNLDDIHQIDIEPHELERYSLRKGDVLMNEGGDNDKLGRGAVWQGDIESCIHQNHVFAIRTENIEPEWLQQLMQSSYAKFYFYSVAKQSTNLASISSSNIKETPLLIPPKLERIKVLSFLDYEIARIDRLIAQQQRLIELLKEKRQAVISHAVTKGLNPDAPMKDSGVEWLGQVPEHWAVSRIKNYAKIESGHTPSRQVEEYWIDCNIPWVSLNDSKTLKVVDYISDTFYKINELGMANSSAHLLPERAVVFTRDASIGLAAITTIPMAVSQHLIAWICNEKKVIPEFLLLIFYAMELEFERYTFGATIKTIGMDDVRSLTAGFPKIDEQKEIITWAFSTLGILKNVLQKAEEKICLLQERRTALITAAVTGKIDLRGWTPPAEEVAA